METLPILGILSATYLGFVLLGVGLPLFLARKSEAPEHGLIWLGISCFAILLSSLSMRIEWANTHWLSILHDYILFPCFLFGFIFFMYVASAHLRHMRPRWLRTFAGFSLASMICVAFGGIAERTDGNHGTFDIPQYGFEFFLRAVDLFSFASLTNFCPEVLENGIVYTSSDSGAVLLFHAVMSLFAANLIMQMVFSTSEKKEQSKI